MRQWWFRGDFHIPNGLWLVIIVHIANLTGLIADIDLLSIIGHIVFSILALITVVFAIIENV